MDERKLKSFERDLKKRVRGGVSFDPVTRGIYATDANIYQLTPVAVVEPVDEEDVFAAVKAASKYGASILPRGGGTSLNARVCQCASTCDDGSAGCRSHGRQTASRTA